MFEVVREPFVAQYVGMQDIRLTFVAWMVEELSYFPIAMLSLLLPKEVGQSVVAQVLKNILGLTAMGKLF